MPAPVQGHVATPGRAIFSPRGPSRAQPGPSASARSMSAGWERGAAAPRVVPAPCASKVELRVSCRHLLDRDPLTKSDPSVVLLLCSQGRWVQVRPDGGWVRRDCGGLAMLAGYSTWRPGAGVGAVG